MNEPKNTLQSILEAGKKEFLEKGFKSASLRNIVKDAGVTTGAFYGYFRSKEDLFEALVGEQAKTMMDNYSEAQHAFASLPADQQPENMASISGDCMEWMVDYVYEHKDAFKLILCAAEGTAYEHFIHKMVEVEVEATHDFVEVLNQLGQQTPYLDSQLEHILISGMFSAFFEMVVHDMPYERAHQYVKELRTFYTAGWEKLLGLAL